MDFGDYGSSSDSELHEEFLNDDDEEEKYASGIVPKLQFRKCDSIARWNDQMEMAEVLEHKGKLWTTMGITRAGKLFCSIEETLFLIEVGALLLRDNNNKPLTLQDIYRKILEGKNGYEWEQFEVYRHLKTLGYIVQRHKVPFSSKSFYINGEASSPLGSLENNDLLDKDSNDKTSIVELFNNLHVKEAMPVFDVYPPNSKFKKSSPGNPSFIVCMTSEYPPSKAKIEELERCCGGLPLKFCHVEHGHITFFSFDKVELPVLP